MAAVMIQGTGSDVGKSLLVAGLCRLFTDRGLRVRPFKPQNMSTNAAVIDGGGGEIGRAQALQAVACRVPATADMNPVLLKPEGDRRAQLIVRGQVRGSWTPDRFRRPRAELLDVAMESFARLSAEADLVIVEGAGSPAETNLRAGDIANMGFAQAARLPVILAGDIDRGGVIAALVGTHAVLDEADAGLIKGFLINRFRGDPALFEPGMAEIARRTAWRPLGIVPWIDAAARLPAEDGASLARSRAPDAPFRIAVPVLPHMANFDDLDPWRLEPSVVLELVGRGQALPVADLIILLGSKATRADLAALKAEGWDIDIRAHLRRGGSVLGLCGGYQMLGRTVADHRGVEGPPGEEAGLGLLDIATELGSTKRLETIEGEDLIAHARFTGYLMHMGRTTGPDTSRPLLALANGGRDGAVSTNGKVMGCYAHGLFARAEQRAAWLARAGQKASGRDHADDVDTALDEVAVALAQSLDIGAIAGIAGL
jgi:adenosylcobyric acid synthase